MAGVPPQETRLREPCSAPRHGVPAPSATLSRGDRRSAACPRRLRWRAQTERRSSRARTSVRRRPPPVTVRRRPPPVTVRRPPVPVPPAGAAAAPTVGSRTGSGTGAPSHLAVIREETTDGMAATEWRPSAGGTGAQARGSTPRGCRRRASPDRGVRPQARSTLHGALAVPQAVPRVLHRFSTAVENSWTRIGPAARSSWITALTPARRGAYLSECPKGPVEGPPGLRSHQGSGISRPVSSGAVLPDRRDRHPGVGTLSGNLVPGLRR